MKEASHSTFWYVEGRRFCGQLESLQGDASMHKN